MIRLSSQGVVRDGGEISLFDLMVGRSHTLTFETEADPKSICFEGASLGDVFIETETDDEEAGFVVHIVSVTFTPHELGSFRADLRVDNATIRIEGVVIHGSPGVRASTRPINRGGRIQNLAVASPQEVSS